MNSRTQAIIITIIFALIALWLGPILWPTSSDLEQPTTGQLPFFIILGIIESLAFGFGVALLWTSAPIIRNVDMKYKRKVLVGLLSLVWLLVSWWPHDRLHMMIGHDMQSLLYIEYGFHVTLIIASVLLSWSFFWLVKERL